MATPIMAGMFVRNRRHTSLQNATEGRPASTSGVGLSSGRKRVGSRATIIASQANDEFAGR